MDADTPCLPQVISHDRELWITALFFSLSLLFSLSNSISAIFFPSVLLSLIAHTGSVISGPWCALRHIITPQCGSHLYGTKEQDGAISFSIVTKVNCCRGYSQWLHRCKTDTSADLVQTIWWLLKQTMVWLDGGWWRPFGHAQGIGFWCSGPERRTGELLRSV